MSGSALALVALFFALLPVTLAQAQNWPQFRGSRAGVAADDPRLPDTWSATENIAWKIDVPGRSWSSPVVWGNHVFVLTAINSAQPNPALNPVGTYLARSLGGPMSGADITKPTDEHRWVLYDVDFQTGKIQWERAIHAAVPPQAVHQKNSYASETPVTDGERVYVFSGYLGLFAFDMSGKPVWSKPMTAPKMRNGWGSAASPVLDDGRLYIVNDNDERSFIAAFDARTGTELWRTDRADEGSNWSTPFVWKNDLRTEIVTTGTKGVRSYDTSGKLLWQLAGMTSIHAVTPIASHGLLFVSSGYFPDSLRPTYAIKAGATGDISLKGDERTNQFIAWSHPTLASAYPSALVVGDQYYTLMDRGIMTSNDPKTGKEIYGRQRIAADSGTFSASPWSYNGKIFAVSEDGDTFVMQAGPELKVLGRNSLDEMTLASPAVANGSLFMRTATKLYRIARSRAPAAPPIEHDYAEVNGVRLHYAKSGSGQLMLFLHGFPEFSYAWNNQLQEFGRDHLAVAPDMRGYNLSSKPGDVDQYRMPLLVEDVRALAAKLGYGADRKFILVGHDWGGVVAWAYAAAHPETIEKLVIVNAPHPAIFGRELRENPAQQKASLYMLMFRGPDAENILSANEHQMLVQIVLGDDLTKRHFTEADKAEYLKAWSQPGALTGGLNYYRASQVGPPTGTAPAADIAALALPKVMVPTLVIWGEKDTALLTGNLNGLDAYVPQLTVRRIPEGTHWVIHEFPALVSQYVREFLGR